MQKVVVGVLRGGPSSEYDISLLSGQAVLQHLPEDFGRRDILVTRDGRWHIDGIETTPDRLHGRVDVIWNAMHGQYGEDGKVQQIFERHYIPYTGSGPLASAIAMNKILTKEHYKKEGIKTPRAVVLDVRAQKGETLLYTEGFRPSVGTGTGYEGISLEIFRKMAPPWVVKPVSSGSSVGITVVRLLKDLPEAIRIAREHSEQILVEEYIRGREVTAGVIDDFRGHSHYSLFPVEVVRHLDKRVLHAPALTLSALEKRVVEELALRVHKSLGLRHYSNTDFIISQRGVYALETNSQPGLTRESLLPKALHAVGSSYPEFLKHITNLAIMGV